MLEFRMRIFMDDFLCYIYRYQIRIFVAHSYIYYVLFVIYRIKVNTLNTFYELNNGKYFKGLTT